MKKYVISLLLLFLMSICVLLAAGIRHAVRLTGGPLIDTSGIVWPFIELLMPDAFIEYKSEEAKKQFLEYVPSDEDKAPALLIHAQGFVGTKIGKVNKSAKDPTGCESITRVVLLSEKKGGIVKESYYSEVIPQTFRSYFGLEDQCNAILAKFLLKDIEEVRTAAKNREFYVAVFSGSVKTKTYQIKKKHQERLGWTPSSFGPGASDL